MFRTAFLTSLIRSFSLKNAPARIGRVSQQGKLCLERLEDRTLLSAAVVGVSTTTPPNSTLSAEQTVNIDVTFSQAVIVSTSSGTPMLTLNAINQSSSAAAVYNSGSGTSTLEFIYHVQSGDTTGGQALDYTSTNALLLFGGTITDVSDAANAMVILPPPGAANDGLFLAHLLINAPAPSPSPSPSPSPTPPGNTPSQIELLFQQFLAMEQGILNDLSQATQLLLPALADSGVVSGQLFDSLVADLPGVSSVLNSMTSLTKPFEQQAVDPFLFTLESALRSLGVFPDATFNTNSAFGNAFSNSPIQSSPSA